MELGPTLRRELVRVRRVGSAVRLSLRSPSPDALQASALSAAGFPPGAPAGYLDDLDDDDLAQINSLLPWACFTVDKRGRRLGDRRRPAKRENPQLIPDWRIELADQHFQLAAKSVLEVGCFEGVHTIALCRAAREVTAIDAHVVNVVKTLVRANLYGCRPVVYTSDVETWAADPTFTFDVVFHVGVLYHLFDPVSHILRLGQVCRAGLLLDTMVATDGQATETMTVGGRTLRYHPYGERTGPMEVLAGMRPQSRWLLLPDLVGLLKEAGFATVEIVDERDERNGRRATLAATASPEL